MATGGTTKRCQWLLTICVVVSGIGLHPAQAQTGLLPGYNSALYPTVLAAARGVAKPFLLQQGYDRMNGVTVTDTILHSSTVNYPVEQLYQNPSAGYTLPAAQYASYGITPFTTLWPQQIPFILYDATAQTYRGHADCVGYMARLLSATGDTSSTGNAYINLMNTVHAAATTLFAYRGYVCTAYQLGAAFPTLSSTNPTGWQYVSGTVMTDSVNNYNHRYRPALGTYNGIRKGGFAQAQGGDVLAFSYSQASSFNGHAMVLEQAPMLLNTDSIKAYMPSQTISKITALQVRFRVYAVPVFDCSGQQAHFRDSRVLQSGMGHGTLLLLTDLTDDAPRGYIFSSGQVSGNTIRYDSLGAGVHAISVGRWKGGNGGLGVTIPATELLLEAVYPNPANEVIHVRFAKTVSGTLEVINASGRVVIRQELKNATSAAPEVKQLPGGLYWLRVSGPSGTVVRGFEKR
ncbi:MAG: T9SS type A sorting domain-containing protein [Sphingobacteriales bacterium]|nr:MAG: T9SS type A sorting domain-containing protein [Sphingobacteriales bacterium]